MVRSLIALWIAVAAAFAVMPARAAPSTEPVAAADARAVHSVVAAQLDAFANDDAARAFSYAAPAIQAMFQTPERFVAMVRAGYPVVYRAAGATFSFRSGSARTSCRAFTSATATAPSGSRPIASSGNATAAGGSRAATCSAPRARPV
jgi:hypothetical protein